MGAERGGGSSSESVQCCVGHANLEENDSRFPFFRSGTSVGTSLHTSCFYNFPQLQTKRIKMPLKKDSVSTLSSEPALEDVQPNLLTPITTLGRGSYGKVVLARIEDESNKDELVAVKIIAKNRIKSRGHVQKAEAELEIMRKISVTTPFLIGCRGAFQTDNCIIVAMNYSSGGELFFHLQREGRFSENKARLIIMQVILGLEQLHMHGVLYRDLKPENVLISSNGRCQLADFGLSKFLPRLQNKINEEEPDEDLKPKKKGIFSKFLFKSKKNLQNHDKPSASEVIWGTTKTRCGTPAYQSPEIVQGLHHGLEADWWALGILFFELITGEPPFFASTVKEVYNLILNDEPVYPKKLSEQARSFMTELLKKDLSNRLGYGLMSISKIKSHSFFKECPAEQQSKCGFYSWEQVTKLDTPPVVFLSEAGVVGSPEDAVFFHADFTCLDVREYIPPSQNKIDLHGFLKVSESNFDSFISSTPIQVVEKNGVSVGDDLSKKKDKKGE